MTDPYRSTGLWYTGRDVEEQEPVIREVTHRELITIRSEIYRVRRDCLEIGEFTCVGGDSQKHQTAPPKEARVEGGH
jgi:hypothetical protein